MSRLCHTLRARAGVLTGDVSGKRAPVTRLLEMDLVCPSESELRDSMRAYDEGLPVVVWRLMEQTGARAALVTMGSEGAVAFDRLPEPEPETERHATGFVSRVSGEHVPALCAHAVDPLGCGDAMLATATLSLAATRKAQGETTHAGLLEAAVLGSLAAATQGQRLGNLPVSASDLRRGVVRLHASHMTFTPAEASTTRRLSVASAS